MQPTASASPRWGFDHLARGAHWDGRIVGGDFPWNIRNSDRSDDEILAMDQRIGERGKGLDVVSAKQTIAVA